MDANGLAAVDSTGVQRGNEGIDIGVWTGPPANPDPVKHLPGHEHSESIALPWLTERRADLLFLALAAVGVYLGVMS